MTKQLIQNNIDYSDVICGLHFVTLIVCQCFVYIDAIYGDRPRPFYVVLPEGAYIVLK